MKIIREERIIDPADLGPEGIILDIREPENPLACCHVDTFGVESEEAVEFAVNALIEAAKIDPKCTHLLLIRLKGTNQIAVAMNYRRFGAFLTEEESAARNK